MNICDYLSRTSQLVPRHPAIIDLDTPDGRLEIDYQTFWRQVRCTAQGLLGLGLRRGDRVALLAANSWEYVETFMALGCAGLVAVPLNIRLLQEELAHMITDSGARLLVAQQSQLADKAELATLTELGTVLIRHAGTLPAGAIAYAALPAATPAAPQDLPPETLMSLMYTSGTTGLPKGVMLSHGAWSATADQALRYLDYSGPERTVHTAALTHGSGFLVLPTMAVGGVNLLCAKFEASRVLELFHDEGVTNGFFVPSMIRMLLDAPAPAGRSGNGAMKTLYYAGAPIDPVTLQEALARFGDVLIQSFAQMEAPMFLSVLDRDDHRAIAAGTAPQLTQSAGRPVLGARVRIVDDEDRDVAPGEVGEIAAIAQQTMLGYWNRPDATAETLRGGWLHTGDLGRIDEAGYLHIVDRKKDMIISGGSNVYAREVEQVLLELPDIAEVAVIGLPHPKWGEMVVAVMVGRDGRQIETGVLETFCRERLPDYRRPKRFIWIDVLPRNPYGKILKRTLRTQFAQA